MMNKKNIFLTSMIKKKLPKYKINEIKAKRITKQKLKEKNEQSTTTQHRSITIN